MVYKKSMLLIFLDTETSGRNPEKHRILEIAFEVYDSQDWRPVLSYESLVRQPAEIWAEADPESLTVNGFSWEDVLKGKTEKTVAAEITNDLNRLNIREKSGVFICQNPSFDRAFFIQLISDDMQRHFGWPYHWLDLASMYWAMRGIEDRGALKKMIEKDLSKNSIAKTLGLPEEKMPHRAKQGVEHLLKCYQHLFKTT